VVVGVFVVEIVVVGIVVVGIVVVGGFVVATAFVVSKPPFNDFLTYKFYIVITQIYLNIQIDVKTKMNN
jgi:hypothetical protein